MNPDQFVEGVLEINPKIRFAAIYFEGNFYSRLREGLTSFLSKEETEESMRHSVMRMKLRQKLTQRIGGIHYAMAKYDKTVRLTMPLGNDGLIMVSIETGSPFDNIAEEIIKFKNQNSRLIE